MPSTNSTFSAIPERWAVVVGCEGYTSLPVVPHALSDAAKVVAGLGNDAYTIVSLTDAAVDGRGVVRREMLRPTLANLRRQIPATLSAGMLGDEDVVLFYFIGQGLQLGDGQDYLVPLDVAKPAEQLTPDDLVSVSWLYDVLTKSGAGQIVVVLDVCRDDGSAADEPFGESAARSLPAGRRFALLRSCQTGQRSYGDAQGGYFTQAFAEAVAGRVVTPTTVNEVYGYARKEVRSRTRGTGLPQTPALTTNCAEAGAIELWEETGVTFDDDEEDDVPAAEPEPERVEPAAPTPKAATAETVRVAERPPAAETEQRATRRGWIVAAVLLLAVGIGVVVTVIERAKPVKDLAAAVAAARPGRVLKLSGTYNLAEPLTIDKPLTLEGDGMDNCRVTCAGLRYVVQFTGAGSWTVSGISFEHTGTNDANVVQVESGQFNATRCRMSGAVGANGLLLTGDSVSNVEECVCEKNDFSGIYYNDNASGTARGNTCRENGYDGIGVHDASHPTLDSNTCENNGDGICYYGSSAGTARGNTCQGNTRYQIYINSSAHPTLENNVGEVYHDRD